MDDKKTEQKIPVRLLLHPVHCLALGFGSGLSPVAPGTLGTLAGVALYVPLCTLPAAQYLAVVAILFLAGIGICHYTSQRLGCHDHRAIVWDEVVGYLAGMSLVPTGWQWMLAGFVIFRVLDIVKPWPIRLVDKKVAGGFGIMLDDLLAGLVTAAALHLFVRGLG